MFLELFRSEPRKGEKTKYRIIQATIQCMAEKGLSGTNFETVGKRVHLARRNVAYHFPSNEEMICAAMRYMIATGQKCAVDFLKKDEAWEAQLRMYIEAMFRWVADEPDQGMALITLLSLATHSEKFRNLYEEVSAVGQRRLELILSKPIADPDKALETAACIYSLLTGMIVRFLTHKRRSTSRKWIKRTTEASLTLVRTA